MEVEGGRPAHRVPRVEKVVCGLPETHGDCLGSKGQVPAALEQMLSDKAKQSNSCNLSDLTFSKKKNQANTVDCAREATSALSLKSKYSWTSVPIFTVHSKQS